MTFIQPEAYTEAIVFYCIISVLWLIGWSHAADEAKREYNRFGQKPHVKNKIKVRSTIALSFAIWPLTVLCGVIYGVFVLFRSLYRGVTM